VVFIAADYTIYSNDIYEHNQTISLPLYSVVIRGVRTNPDVIEQKISSQILSKISPGFRSYYYFSIGLATIFPHSVHDPS